MYKKNNVSEDCTKHFNVNDMGHVACCADMERMLGATTKRTNYMGEIYNSEVVNAYTYNNDGVVEANVRFDSDNMPYGSITHCPFCGEEVTVADVDELLQ